MIEFVYKRKHNKNIDGKIETISSKTYYGEIRLDGEGVVRNYNLKTSDKSVAEDKLKKIRKELELEKAGIIPEKSLRESANQSLSIYFNEFIDDLMSKRRDNEYVALARRRLSKIAAECQWKLVRDIQVSSFLQWRTKNATRQPKPLEPKTLNDYLNLVSSFLGWMVKRRLLLTNVLASVDKVETMGQVGRQRRAFTDDEIDRLLKVSKQRAIVYLTAVYTGLRRRELFELDIADLHLDAENPHFLARASTTKNKKAARIPLHPQLVKALKNFLVRRRRQSSRLFARLLPDMPRFKADLELAKIPYQDAQGNYADFHSFRKTYATNLLRSGIPHRVVMDLMRHSDIRLTTKVYTDNDQLPTFDAAASLPWLGSEKVTQKLTQETVATSGNVSQAVKIASLKPKAAHVESVADCLDVTQLDVQVVDNKRIAGAGFEPAAFRL